MCEDSPKLFPHQDFFFSNKHAAHQGSLRKARPPHAARHPRIRFCSSIPTRRSPRHGQDSVPTCGSSLLSMDVISGVLLQRVCVMQEMLVHMYRTDDDVETKTCIPVPWLLAMGNAAVRLTLSTRSGIITSATTTPSQPILASCPVAFVLNTLLFHQDLSMR